MTAEPDTRNVYLGRPWRPYANVLFEACKIGGHVHPTGWDNWDDKKNEQTVKFSERNNNYETSIKRPEWIHLEKQGFRNEKKMGTIARNGRWQSIFDFLWRVSSYFK